jgi:hypothetical protein
MLKYLPNRWWSPRAWRTWSSYIHWRLETYGVYHPGGKFNGKAFVSLVLQFPHYNRWLTEIKKLRNKPITTR